MSKQVMITGCPRTGTTALSTLLSHCEGVFISNELAIYENPPRILEHHLSMLDSSPNWNQNLRNILKIKGWSNADLRRFLSNGFNDDIKLTGDKFPAYCIIDELMSDIADSSPCSHYIFTHRNPCAVVASFLRRSRIENHPKAFWYATTAEEALEKVISYTLNWSTILWEALEKKIIITHEDYCDNAGKLLDKLSDFLDLELKMGTHKPEDIYRSTNNAGLCSKSYYKDELSTKEIDMINAKFSPIQEHVMRLYHG